MSVFWLDKVTSYRTEDVAEGFITSQQEVKKSDDAPCHYSMSSKKVSVTSGTTTIQSEQVLFCALNTDIHEGDRLVITQRNGNIIDATAGEIFPYSNKMQVAVKRDDTL